MQGIIHFETFLLTGILLNLTPGNDTIFILSKSLGQGKKAGIISALGIGSGSVIHTLLAAFGLSMIIAESLFLYNLIKYAGAVYLLYLGYKMLMQQSEFKTAMIATRLASNIQIYRDAMITNLLNPKVALFFIAFLPQFIDAGYKHSVTPFLLLGITFIVTGTIWCMLLAIFSSAIFSRLKQDSRLSVYMNRICGIALLAIGLKVALSRGN